MNLEKLTHKSKEMLSKVHSLVESKGQQAIEPAHVLKIMLQIDENAFPFLFKELNINHKIFNLVLDKIIDNYPKVTGGTIQLSKKNK